MNFNFSSAVTGLRMVMNFLNLICLAVPKSLSLVIHGFKTLLYGRTGLHNCSFQLDLSSHLVALLLLSYGFKEVCFLMICVGIIVTDLISCFLTGTAVDGLGSLGFACWRTSGK